MALEIEANKQQTPAAVEVLLSADAQWRGSRTNKLNDALTSEVLSS